MDNFGFLKVAAAVPHVRVADCDYNTERMAAMAEEAARRGVEIVAFPELGVTAYTCGDLLLQQTLLDAADEALERLVRATRKLPLTLIAGAPLRHGSTLYNCAVVFTQGKVLGVVPKTYIPDYGEFYENRWFASGAGISEETISVAEQSADFGADLTFGINGTEFGVEICEDLWTAAPPSSQLALNGAKVIFNLSASPESVGKHAYLRQLVAQQSGRAIAAYVYCSAGFGESTTDLVFAGNAVIAENGCILREAARFSPDEQLIVADVDIERLEFERRRNTSFRANEGATENTVIEMEIPEGLRGVALDRDIDPMPFVPKDEADRSERCEEIFRIQSHGLAQRMVHTRSEKAVVGISGGLDSTLALLVTARTFDFLHLDRAGIIGITMPGFGTTDRTYNNALELMRGLGVTIREIPIRDACSQHFSDIGLDPEDRSAAYENSQARERTQILMDYANKVGGIVLGKYFALCVIFALPCLVDAGMILVLKVLGATGTSTLANFSALLCYYLMGCAAIAIGVFLSSLTENQIIAAVSGVAALLLAYMMPSLRTMFTTGSAVALALFTAIAAVLSVVAGLRSKSFTLGCLSFAGCCVALTALFLLKSSWLTEAFSAVLNALCLFTPFEEFVNSSFSIPTLVYYLTVAAVFLFFTAQGLEKRRWN